MKNLGFAYQPGQGEPIADSAGRVTRVWANYFAKLAMVQTSDELRDLYLALAERVGKLEDGQALTIIGRNSVRTVGTGQVEIQLVGDEDAPGNTEYYGTNAAGEKGFHPVADAIEVEVADLTKAVGLDGIITLGLAEVPDSGTGTLQAITVDGKGRVTGTKDATITGTAGQIAVANGNASSGLPTISLVDVPDAGGGALQKTQFDAKGRKTGTSAATTDDLPEGSANLYFTTGRAAAAAPVQSVNGQTGTVVIPVSVSQGYIEGLRLEWVSATSIRVNSGAAYVPGPGSAVALGAAVTKSGLSLTANTWYHVYLFDNAGTADVEISSTDPAAPYFGTARVKTGDASRRYIASVRAATGGGIIQFQHDVAASGMSYLGGEYSLRNVLSGGKATTATTVSVASLAPLTSTAVDILATNAATAGTAISGNSEQALPLAAGAGNSYFGYFNPNGGVGVPGHPIDSSRAFQYRFLSTPTGAGLYIDFNGYRFFR